MRSAVIFALAVLLSGCKPAAPKPVYQGKTASEWAMILGDRDFRVRLQAVEALSNLRDDKEVAVPALKSCLHDGNSEVERKAAWHVWSITKDPALVVPLYVRDLDDSDSEIRSKAALCLTDIGPPAKAALPALRKHASKVSEPDATVRNFAEDAVYAITHPNAANK